MMESYLLKSIIILSIVLAALLIVYIGYRLSDWLGYRSIRETLARAEAELIPRVFAKHPDRQATTLLAQARYLEHRQRTSKEKGRPAALLQQDVDAFAKDLGGFLADNDVIGPKRGVILKGFVSDIDNSLRTCSVYVPESYDGSRAYPLIVSLHGHGWFRPFQGHPAPEYDGAIVLSPEGRRATDYMWIGEEDVLQAIDEVKQDYAIDEARVYLTGGSMGGTGCWQLAVHYPQLFAGIAPRAANCDFEAWRKRWAWSEPLPHQHRGLRDHILRADSPITWMRNVTDMPVYVIHDAGDQVVPVEHARAAVARLRAMGAPVEYREFMAGKHGGFAREAIDDQLAWVAGRARTEPRRNYVFEADSLRHGRSDFVDIEQMERVLEPARIEVMLTDDALEIETANVLLLSVNRKRLSQILGSERRGLPVRIDGEWAVEIGMPADRWASFMKTDDGWRVLDGPLGPTPLRKHRGLEGPVQDVALAPFTVVYGTGGGRAWEAASREEAQRFVAEWKRRYGNPCRIHADNELTGETINRLNLVFFGRPADDSRMKPIVDAMPIRVDDAGVQSGGRRFSGDDVGAIFCYPNPQAPDRLVAVYSAATPGALYQVSMRFGNWFNWGIHDTREWFDFGVYDARTANPETWRTVGFFGTDWSFQHGRAWGPLAECVAETLPQHVPPLSGPAGDVLYLSDLKPLTIDQMRGAVGFDRSFRGHRVRLLEADILDEFVTHRPKTLQRMDVERCVTLACERGLGVRCPSTLSFDIGGGYRTFRALVGFSYEPEEGFSADRLKKEAVSFVVLGDGKVLHTEEIDWELPSASIDVDVTGVRKLTLKVAARGGALWLHGSTAWGDARVEK